MRFLPKTHTNILIYHSSVTVMKGSEGSAAAYSIVETAKVNGLDCRKCLTYLFEKLSHLNFRSNPNLFEWFLPWKPEIQENWK